MVSAAIIALMIASSVTSTVAMKIGSIPPEGTLVTCTGDVAGALLPPLLLYGGIAYAVFTLIVWRHNDFVRPQLGRA